MAELAALRRKLWYSYAGFLLSLLLLAPIIVDFVAYNVLESADVIPFGWRPALELVHTAAILMGVVGFIYSYEAGDKFSIRLCALFLAFSFATYILRITIELEYYDFHPHT